MDPYKVLGVSYDASEDEIKSAYRKLSRMYHPDANVGKPNQKELEEKFKEVQQAYSMIMDQKQGKTTAQSGYGYGGQQSQGGYYDAQDFWETFFGSGFAGGQQYQSQRRQETQEDQYLRSARNYIQNGYYREGLNVLEQIEPSRRHGEWYYISAVANYRVGNNAIALDHIRSACALEPNNMQYRSFMDQLQGGGSRYQQRSGYYGGNPAGGMSVSYCPSSCCTLAMLSMCCGGGGMPIICCL